MMRIGSMVVGVLALSALSSCGGDSDGCPAGEMKGGCGLADQCVECIVDAHCDDAGGSCRYDGTCIATSICVTDDDCPPDLKCFDGICDVACSDDTDCEAHERCNGQFCYQAWCTEDGTCPEGWDAIEGSLRCSWGGS